MRLKTKAFIISEFIWALLLSIPLLFNPPFATIHYAVATLIISLFVYVYFRLFIIKRIEKINAALSDMTANNSIAQRLEVEGYDEIALIAAQINLLIDTVLTTKNEMEQHTQHYLDDLQKTNYQLQEEINALQKIEKRITAHQEGLTFLAQNDSLTSLPNRVFFNESLNKAITHAKRHHKILAVLNLNLDGFQQINAQWGRHRQCPSKRISGAVCHDTADR